MPRSLKMELKGAIFFGIFANFSKFIEIDVFHERKRKNSKSTYIITNSYNYGDFKITPYC